MAGLALGRPYGRLWGATAVSNLGDGIILGAGPLLAMSVTRNPVTVAGLTAASTLPWLLFSLPAGAWVDRTDRRRLMVGVDAGRAVLLALLAVGVSMESLRLVSLYVVLFLVGVGETAVDNAAQALVPDLVDTAALDRANGRLLAVERAANEIAGPPLGAALFGAAAALPFAIDSASFAASAGLLAVLYGARPRIRARRRRGRPAPGEPGLERVGAAAGAATAALPAGRAGVPVVTGRAGPGHGPSGPGGAGAAPDAPDAEGEVSSTRPRLRDAIAEGLHWVRGERAIMRLTAIAAAANMAAGGVLGILVLFAREHLGVSSLGFGLLLGAASVGGLLGGLAASRVVTGMGRGSVLVGMLFLEAGTDVVVALSRDVVVVVAFLGAGAFCAAVWAVVATSLRQAIVPRELLGRVNSVYRLAGMGALPVGAVAGGLLAGAFGLTAPFWASASVLAVLGLVALPLRHDTVAALARARQREREGRAR